MSIKLENVNYFYSQGTAYEKQALKDINLEIKKGEFVGIAGHTGSGKSTLIQHLNGLEKANISLGVITALCKQIPFYNLGFGWIIPAIIGAMIGTLPFWAMNQEPVEEVYAEIGE